ncbi:MAG: CNNM domain-containing protein [Planctomycetota bacterium]
MTVALLVLGALAGVLLSGAVSAVETGSYVLNRVRLRVRAAREEPGARRLATLMERPDDIILMALLGNTLADYVCTVCVASLLLYAAVSGSTVELWTTLITTPLLLVLGGIIPKDWFRREADRWMYVLALPVEIAVRLARLTGFLWLMRKVNRWLVARLEPGDGERDGSLMPRARVLRLLHEGAAAGGLTEFQRDVIERVMRLSEVRVANVMIPRARMAAVPRDIPRDDFLRIVRMAHFSRLPVYQGDARHVVGVVYAFDVLTDPQPRPIADYLRQPLVLREHEGVSAALLRLQQAREAMAIVADRIGQCVGILTLKDLVEEIVGDLEVW